MRLAEAAARTLAALPPDLREAFAAAVPRAAGHVSRQLLAALYTERIGDTSAVTFAGERYPADRIVVTGDIRHRGEVVTDPAELLFHVTGERPPLADELVDAAVNLALGYARRPAGTGDPLAEAARSGPDAGAVFLERLATEGHNLHPCARTRLGMSAADLLAYDLECAGTHLAFVAVRRDAHVGDDVGAALGVPADGDYVYQPVHPWQLDNVLRTRQAGAFAAGLLREADGLTIPASPTSSIRTLYTGEHLVKVALDVQITSTRRSISLATARNGPAVSALVSALLPAGSVLQAEYAGAGARLPAGDRDATGLLRTPLAGQVEPGELAVPGCSLPATCPATGRTILRLLLDAHGGGAEAFLAEYAAALLPPVLELMRHGVGLEAHLQNCVPLFRDGHPTRMVFRDLGGVRLHLPRLAEHGHHLDLWPGSVTPTEDLDVLYAKVIYTALDNHLGAVVDGLGLTHTGGWKIVRDALGDAEPALLAATWPHKALVGMRLSGGGDSYVRVASPL